jgi:hypothetical protein
MALGYGESKLGNSGVWQPAAEKLPGYTCQRQKHYAFQVLGCSY